nr:MAG TPA_asm: hypothetical protein [Caudoviricetes sp.]
MRIAENAAVLVFLIYLKHIDNHGFCIRFRCSSTLFIQWGVTTYNSNPNGQVIIPAISFNSFFAGVVVDRGIKWNTGELMPELTALKVT